MQQRLENFIAKAAIALDHIILPLKIEWKHDYRRERIQLYPSVKFCKELQECETQTKQCRNEKTNIKYFQKSFKESLTNQLI